MGPSLCEVEERGCSTFANLLDPCFGIDEGFVYFVPSSFEAASAFARGSASMELDRCLCAADLHAAKNGNSRLKTMESIGPLLVSTCS